MSGIPLIARGGGGLRLCTLVFLYVAETITIAMTIASITSLVWLRLLQVQFRPCMCTLCANMHACLRITLKYASSFLTSAKLTLSRSGCLDARQRFHQVPGCLGLVLLCNFTSMYVRMYACMYVCMYMYVCMCMHACLYVCTHACVHTCMYVCMYARMYVCMYACMYVYMYTGKHACMYVCMHACMYLCMHACKDTRDTMTATDTTAPGSPGRLLLALRPRQSAPPPVADSAEALIKVAADAIPITP